MRWNNDIELAENVPEIDIILGGKKIKNEINNNYKLIIISI